MSAEVIDLANRRPADSKNSVDAGRTYVALLLTEAAAAIERGVDAEAIGPVRDVFNFLERYVNRDNTDRGHARGYLLAAAEHIADDDISRALGSARMALRVLEELDADGVTLEKDRRRLEVRVPRMAAAAKAAETRKRNREAARK